MTRVALLSDVHANLPALEAVAADIARGSPDSVFVLGDMINGCAWPAETLDFVNGRGWSMIVGNHDDAVLQLGEPRMEPRYADRTFYATLWWTRARLSDSHLAQLISLPLLASLCVPDAPAVRLLHGVPGNFFVGFRPDSPEEWMLQRLAQVGEPTVAGGHTHLPMNRNVGHWQVLNCGSVGAPYDGDPRPGYVLLTSHQGGWRVQFRRIEYDPERVDAGYRSSGLSEECGALGTMFHRTVLTGQPFVSDFHWWARRQPVDLLADQARLLSLYDSQYGPGRWAFPLVG